MEYKFQESKEFVSLDHGCIPWCQNSFWFMGIQYMLDIWVNEDNITDRIIF